MSEVTKPVALDETLQRIANVMEGESNNWRVGLRFKNLGNSFTPAQQAALANDDFSEFWNGDYWEIGGRKWLIVDNSGIARRRGDTNFDSPSLIIMPEHNLVAADAYIIDGGTSHSNTDTHGYSNCGYRTDEVSGKGRTACKSIIASAFGASHIASHRELLSTGRGASGATGWGWTDADVELPSEVNIYGHNVWAKSADTNGGGAYNTGDRWGQFMLFKLAPYMAIDRTENYWLRDMVSASDYADVNHYGNAGNNAPSNPSVGLRPYFILK